MSKVSMCRVCLSEDVRLYYVVNTHLQETYEALTSMTLETEDSRPVQACYICYAKLQNSYKLRKTCLQSEELFTQMTRSGTAVKLTGEHSNGLTVTAVVHLNIGNERHWAAEAEVKDEIPVTPDGHAIAHEGTNAESLYNDCIALFEDTGGSDTEDVELQDIVKEKLHCAETSPPLFGDTSSPQRVDFVKSACSPELAFSNVKISKMVSWEDNNFSEGIRNNVTKNVNEENENNATPSISCPTKKLAIYRNTQRLRTYARTQNNTGHSGAENVTNQSEAKSHSIRGKKRCTCSICMKTFVKQKYSLKNTIHFTNPYQCDICDVFLQTKNLLLQHMRKHIEKKSYQCKICNETFALQRNLLSHMSLHAVQKPYQCKVCKKSYAFPSLLTEHVRIHTAFKPNQCSFCKKCFASSSLLTEHLPIHTEQPNLCSICNVAFANRSVLRAHTQRAHGVKNSYQCTICNKFFVRQYDLDTHIYDCVDPLEN